MPSVCRYSEPDANAFAMWQSSWIDLRIMVVAGKMEYALTCLAMAGCFIAGSTRPYRLGNNVPATEREIG